MFTSVKHGTQFNDEGNNHTLNCTATSELFQWDNCCTFVIFMLFLNIQFRTIIYTFWVIHINLPKTRAFYSHIKVLFHLTGSFLSSFNLLSNNFIWLKEKKMLAMHSFFFNTNHTLDHSPSVPSSHNVKYSVSKIFLQCLLTLSYNCC